MPAPTATPAAPNRRELLLVALACVWFWVSAWTAVKDLPPVADEIAHVTGGETYWRYGVNHLQPEMAYLPMRWSTIPLRFHPPAYPAVSRDLPQGLAMVTVGNQFFYDLGNDPAMMLVRARAMMAGVGVALLLLVWWWSRRVWGPAGGLLSAGLAAFCPTLLANSGLVMSDVTFSFFLLLSVLLWWRLLREVSPGRLLAAGGALGALLLTKSSGVIAGPVFLLLAFIRWLDPEPLAWRVRQPRPAGLGFRKFALLAGTGCATALVAASVIWAAFGFHFSMFANPAAPLPLPRLTWATYLHEPGLMPQVIGVLLRFHLLPEAWLNGLAVPFHDMEGRQAFLNGRSYIGGSLLYFPYAFLVKTPLALFGLMALALAAALGRNRAVAGWRVTAPLLVVSALYWAFALPSSINIGHRHLMPVYATTLILAGGAAAWFARRPVWLRGAVVLLAVWFALESWWVRPRYLSYFNQLAGGPPNGYHHLVDSNLDSGQDLIALRDWLAAHAASEPVFLTFFGPGDPTGYGIKSTRFSDNGFDARVRTMLPRVTGGVYCMSVTLFQGIYTLTPGPWTAKREVRYRELLTIARTRAPTSIEALTLEHLQFARMRYVLATQKPDARVGDTILIYRLTDKEVAWMLYAPREEIDRIAHAPRA